MDKVHHISSTLGLKININKTEVQNISKEPKHIHIMIDGKELTQVDNFTYLGGIISQDGSNSQDIKQRIGKAMGAVQKLHNIWNSTNIRVSTKTELYRVLILSILLYGAETWTLKKEDENRLLVFEMACLRKILGITRMDKVRNTTIRKQLNIQQTVINQICQKRLRYFGHIERMPVTRFPKITLEGRIEGNRPRGRPPKRWSDCVKTDCRQKHIYSLTEASHAARDRLRWQEVMKRMPPLNPVLE